MNKTSKFQSLYSVSSFTATSLESAVYKGKESVARSWEDTKEFAEEVAYSLKMFYWTLALFGLMTLSFFFCTIAQYVQIKVPWLRTGVTSATRMLTNTIGAINVPRAITTSSEQDVEGEQHSHVFQKSPRSRAF